MKLHYSYVGKTQTIERTSIRRTTNDDIIVFQAVENKLVLALFEHKSFEPTSYALT